MTSITNDKLIFESDNNNFYVTQKNSTSARIEVVELTLRIRDTEMSTFYNFIKSNFGSVVQFTYSGVQPFINASESQDVVIIEYSEPIKDREKIYTMTIKLKKS